SPIPRTTLYAAFGRARVPTWRPSQEQRVPAAPTQLERLLHSTIRPASPWTAAEIYGSSIPVTTPFDEFNSRQVLFRPSQDLPDRPVHKTEPDRLRVSILPWASYSKWKATPKNSNANGASIRRRQSG